MKTKIVEQNDQRGVEHRLAKWDKDRPFSYFFVYILPVAAGCFCAVLIELSGWCREQLVGLLSSKIFTIWLQSKSLLKSVTET